MTLALAHRQSIPILIAIPDDPDALRLMRLLVALLDFIWLHRYTFLSAADTIGNVAAFVSGVVLAVEELAIEPALQRWLVMVFRLVLFT